MTDQADTGPVDLAGIRARWSRNGGMGNDRSDEDYTDAGCRILARAAFRDFPVLDAEVRALRAENEQLSSELVTMSAQWVNTGLYGARVAKERDSALAELAAARDQIAAVAEAVARADMAIAHGGIEAARDRLADALAALSQSGQPTKETP